MIEVPAGVLPIQDLTTEQVLYGSRTTSFRFEILNHDSSTGIDSLSGYLDGVQPIGGLVWESGQAKSGTMSVLDLASAAPGMTRIADIDLNTARVRPVRIVDGLPEVPLGVYVLNAQPEQWSGTGRIHELVLHDKSTVLEQDAIPESFTAGTSEPILEIVADVIASAGETISFDGSDTRTLAVARTWEVGTSKLQIVNDLLIESLGYFALRVSGSGNFRAEPYLEPSERSVRYAVLNDVDGEPLIRELRDGEKSIYEPVWTRDRVSYDIPNQVIAVATGTGAEPALSRAATNDNPNSPFSTVSRGRVITSRSGPLRVNVPDFSAEPDPEAATLAFLEGAARRSLIAQTSRQSSVEIDHLPIPCDVLDAILFSNTPAGIDARHTLRSTRIPFSFDGLQHSVLAEVVSL